MNEQSASDQDSHDSPLEVRNAVRVIPLEFPSRPFRTPRLQDQRLMLVRFLDLKVDELLPWVFTARSVEEQGRGLARDGPNSTSHQQ